MKSTPKTLPRPGEGRPVDGAPREHEPEVTHFALWQIEDRASDALHYELPPLADRQHRDRFVTLGPYVCWVCGCVGNRPHAPGCAQYARELLHEQTEIAATVRAAVVADRAAVVARAERLATDWRWSGAATGHRGEREVAIAAAAILRAFAARISRDLPAAAVPPALALDAAAAIRAATAALRRVREVMRSCVRAADEFDHDLSCVGEYFEAVRVAIEDFDRACDVSIAAQDAGRSALPLPPFEE